jgi:hypothetical protein
MAEKASPGVSHNKNDLGPLKLDASFADGMGKLSETQKVNRLM